MRDPATLRPCQLAKSLGELGDARYVSLLAAAATQTENADLRVCATIALGDLASSTALSALVDAYQRELVTTTALSSIGLIGDPSALPFLRSVAASPRNDSERRSALLAIRRIEIL
jgi:HEAT repeat protein